MALVRMGNGDEMLSFVACGEGVIPSDDAHIPLTFVVVAARFQDRWLMLYTSERHQWELPGGAIEPGESLRDCAAREVMEETGQTVARLHWKGLFRIHLFHPGRMELGGLYSGELDELGPFTPNVEADRITLWRPGDVLDGHFGELSQKLLESCGAALQ